MPGNLDELVPKYLPELPKDPFSDQDFIYRLEDGDWKLYSVGPNTKDDGGLREPYNSARIFVADSIDILYHRGPMRG